MAVVAEDDAESSLPLSSGFPRVNLFDAGSNLVLKADVPGLSEKDVQVTLNKGGISLTGERKVVARASASCEMAASPIG